MFIGICLCLYNYLSSYLWLSLSLSLALCVCVCVCGCARLAPSASIPRLRFPYLVYMVYTAHHISSPLIPGNLILTRILQTCAHPPATHLNGSSPTERLWEGTQTAENAQPTQPNHFHRDMHVVYRFYLYVFVFLHICKVCMPRRHQASAKN